MNRATVMMARTERAKYLDEDVADTRLAKLGVAVRPHDPNGLSTKLGIVESLQCSGGYTE